MASGKIKSGIILSALLLLGGASAQPGSSGTERKVIRISAQRFHYTPAQVELKRGVPVTLELVSLDRLHGFSVPGLGIHVDLLPGESVRVELTPHESGSFPFLCNIFCGDGHDDMNGIITVTD